MLWNVQDVCRKKSSENTFFIVLDSLKHPFYHSKFLIWCNLFLKWMMWRKCDHIWLKDCCLNGSLIEFILGAVMCWMCRLWLSTELVKTKPSQNKTNKKTAIHINDCCCKDWKSKYLKIKSNTPHHIPPIHTQTLTCAWHLFHRCTQSQHSLQLLTRPCCSLHQCLLWYQCWCWNAHKYICVVLFEEASHEPDGRM